MTSWPYHGDFIKPDSDGKSSQPNICVYQNIEHNKSQPYWGLFSILQLFLTPYLEDRIVPSVQPQVSDCWKKKFTQDNVPKIHQTGQQNRKESYLSINNWRHSSNFPNINRQRNATLFFPCDLARDASSDMPSESPKDEYNSNKPLKSFACFKHSSAISNCKIRKCSLI